MYYDLLFAARVFDFSITLPSLHLGIFRSDDLKRRFIKAETILFKVRYGSVMTADRKDLLNSRDFNWVAVSEPVVDITRPLTDVGLC